MPSLQAPSKLVVAIDFGETNSSVSYAFFLIESTQKASIWLGNAMSLEVPTLMRYPNNWEFRSLDELRREPPGTSHSVNGQVHWGFQVQQHMAKVMSHSDNTHSLLYGFKNLINQSENHEIQNRHLIETLNQLSKNGSCSREISVQEMVLLVTIDYLTNLLSHAKTEITESTIITSTELVICVPVIWRQKALRDIQTCVAIAAKRVNFPGVDFGNDCVTQVFMITEPEAAATWLLSRTRSMIKRGDVFTILDAGGGTCDALTYIVTRKSPLRLERQLVHHSGGTCGSNALNAAFRELLENLLAAHDYLNKDGATLKGHICKLAAHDFEHYLKTGWAVSQNSQDWVLEVFGLRSDPGSRNQATDNQQSCPHRLTIQAEHLNNIYRRVCDEVSMLMTKQLHATTQLGLKTGKVVLAGGFGESKPLRTRLREALASFNAAQNSNVELHVAGEHDRITAVDAVSSGGVLRALDKLYGPTRVANSSYGVRCDEPFLHAMHADKLVTDKYTQGQAIPPSFRIPAPRYCTFPFWNDDGTINKGPFTCQEEIWVSDEAYLDHHSYLHEHNKDAQKIGVFSTDVTHLHQDFLLEGQGAQASGGTRYLYWRFPYELVLTIDGLNMKSAVHAEICKLGALRYRH
ncbi:hypothetical protein FANTH_9785 [Fusarium anthophilum]|uniref:Uncharacterized protein n=1 Tax=Fusarium anthophilum TaxID=48485 RepID=A0A8H4Z4K0_9HYPO|nr:hypothetical protein FANTH_9785 [Fusarium anthophilum]